MIKIPLPLKAMVKRRGEEFLLEKWYQT